MCPLLAKHTPLSISQVDNNTVRHRIFKRISVTPAHPRRCLTHRPRASQDRRFSRRTRPFPGEAAGSAVTEAYPQRYVAGRCATENEVGSPFQHPDFGRLCSISRLICSTRASQLSWLTAAMRLRTAEGLVSSTAASNWATNSSRV